MTFVPNCEGSMCIMQGFLFHGFSKAETACTVIHLMVDLMSAALVKILCKVGEWMFEQMRVLSQLLYPAELLA